KVGQSGKTRFSLFKEVWLCQRRRRRRRRRRRLRRRRPRRNEARTAVTRISGGPSDHKDGLFRFWISLRATGVACAKAVAQRRCMGGARIRHIKKISQGPTGEAAPPAANRADFSSQRLAETSSLSHTAQAGLMNRGVLRCAPSLFP